MNAEGATLDPSSIKLILQLLENGSLAETVRSNLSEKKKIKDLFLVVIRAIDVDQNRRLVSSLIQFAANLCYGTAKFRKMLLNENPAQFVSTLSTILSSVKSTKITFDSLNTNEESKINE